MKKEAKLTPRSLAMLRRLAGEREAIQKKIDRLQGKLRAASFTEAEAALCALEAHGFEPPHFQTLDITPEGVATWDDTPKGEKAKASEKAKSKKEARAKLKERAKAQLIDETAKALVEKGKQALAEGGLVGAGSKNGTENGSE